MPEAYKTRHTSLPKQDSSVLMQATLHTQQLTHTNGADLLTHQLFFTQVPPSKRDTIPLFFYQVSESAYEEGKKESRRRLLPLNCQLPPLSFRRSLNLLSRLTCRIAAALPAASAEGESTDEPPLDVSLMARLDGRGALSGSMQSMATGQRASTFAFSPSDLANSALNGTVRIR
mmetsp:Transcript_26767/g.66579  ORF Transcript_26767/g.66579 Transcript_26767/m.66579 type:complete len:174 (-) Transcript_26767:2144-2665(-)